MRSYLFDDRGSLPLALLVVIVLGSVSALLLSNVVTTQSSTRFDRDFTEAVQVADAGIQEALVRLNSSAPMPSGTAFAGDVDGKAYSVTPTLLGPNEWEFTSTATVDGVTRTLTATTKEMPLFGFALYARNGVGFNGANAADSYDARINEWCTGNGIVGTDGTFDFSGLAPAGTCHAQAGFKKVTVDGAVLYECATDDVACAAARCTHSGGENCTPASTTMSNGAKGRLSVLPNAFKLTPEEELERIRTENAVCETAGWNDPPPPGVAERTNGDWLMDEGDVLTPAPASLGRDFYCVNSLKFTDDTTVDATGGEVRIAVNSNISVEGTRTTVNCPGCSSNAPYAIMPSAPDLQIHGINMTSFELADPQQMFAGGVYAPNALCEGPAGADIYGSLICQLADNVGAWNFHYDDRFDAAGGTGVWALDRYREDM